MSRFAHVISGWVLSAFKIIALCNCVFLSRFGQTPLVVGVHGPPNGGGKADAQGQERNRPCGADDFVAAGPLRKAITDAWPASDLAR